MRKSISLVLWAALLCGTALAENGNGGYLLRNQVSEPKKFSSENKNGSWSSAATMADREGWRSGISGTFVMWGRLIDGMLPKNESSAPAKKTPPKS